MSSKYWLSLPLEAIATCLGLNEIRFREDYVDLKFFYDSKSKLLAFVPRLRPLTAVRHARTRGWVKGFYRPSSPQRVYFQTEALRVRLGIAFRSTVTLPLFFDAEKGHLGAFVKLPKPKPPSNKRKPGKTPGTSKGKYASK
jgi:hypothetical protein